MKVRCEDCGILVSEDAKFCPQCGCPVPDTEEEMTWKRQRRISGAAALGSIGWYVFSVYMDRKKS